MHQQIIHRILAISVMVLVSATLALGQSRESTETLTLNPGGTWEGARLIGSSKGRLFVITHDQPHRRQACRVQSFTNDKLVCTRALGGPRTFLPQQVAALIIPGDRRMKLWLLLGFNAGMGTAIWGTVVLAAACPACAVATGIAALCLFSGAGAIMIGDDQPDRLLYLAPGQALSRRLGYVQS